MDKEGVKVVRRLETDRRVSAVVYDTLFSTTYNTNGTPTFPRKRGTKLMFFESEHYARKFTSALDSPHVEYWKCVGHNVSHPRVISLCYYWEMLLFWNNLDEGVTPVRARTGTPPPGTLWCDSLTLMERLRYMP